MHRGKKPHDLVLHAVCILKLVDVDIAEFARKVFERVFIRFEKTQRLGEQVVEVERVVRLQVRLIGGVYAADLADIFYVRAPLFVIFGGKPEHLRVRDVEFRVFEQFFVLEAAFRERLFDDVIAFRFAVNGKIFVVADAFGILAQDAHAHAVYGAYPHFFRAVNHARKALLHLVRRLVRKGDGEDRRGVNPLFFHEVGDARGQNARFAAARPREHEYRTLGVEHGFDLFGIEFVEYVIHLMQRAPARRARPFSYSFLYDSLTV